MFNMKIYILTAFPEINDNFAFQNIMKSSLYDPFKKYLLEEDAKVADIIIFVEHHYGKDPYFFQILKHPIYKLYKEKQIPKHKILLDEWLINDRRNKG